MTNSSRYDTIIKYFRKTKFYFLSLLFLETFSRCSAVGSAPVSGRCHRFNSQKKQKSPNPLKTLTFSALPNAEQVSKNGYDHMFDPLRKKLKKITKSRCSAVGSAPVSGTCGLLFNRASSRMPKPLENTRLFALHQLRKNGQNSGLTT